MGHSRSSWSGRKEAQIRAKALRVQQLRIKNTQMRAKNRAFERIRRQEIAPESVSNEGSSFVNLHSINRSAAIHARQLAHTVLEQIREKGFEYQRALLHKFLEQPLLQKVFPEYVVNREQLEQSMIVCNDLKEAWKGLKYGVGRDRYLARNVIEAAVISVGDDQCVQAAAKCIGMNKRTLQRAVRRRHFLNEGKEGEVWAKNDRKKRKDALQQHVIDAVVAWWTEETRVSPCKKDVQKKRVGLNRKICHALHWLEESQLDFYTSFKATHNNLKCSFVSFRRLRPFFVKRLRDFNSCCCRYDQEMVEITIGFNNMRATQFHLERGAQNCTCGCETLCSNPVRGGVVAGAVACQSFHHTYKRKSELWEKSLCPRPENSDWHNMMCITGACNNCGIKLIPICEREILPETEKQLAWRRFEMVVAGKTKKGDPKKVVRLEYKRTTTRAFLEFALPKIPAFVIHQHTASWQDKQYKASLANLQEGEIMSLIDFAENYSFKGQNEIQSQHWYNFQLTILVHITYTLNPNFNCMDPTSKLLKTSYHYYISDDRVHDSLFIQHCLNIHWNGLKASGNIPTRHIVWSDGCAAQFKDATSWFYVSRYPSLTVCEELPSGCKMDWHFWGTGHGKGPHDGAGACLKQTLRKEQLRPDSRKLHNAADVVDFLKVAMNFPNGAYPSAKRVVDRHFHLIGKTEVSRVNPMACTTIPGSRSMHSIRSVGHSNNVLLQCRDFSCFCSCCIHDTVGICPSRFHVSPWKLVILEPISAVEAVQEPEDLEQEWSVEPNSHALALELEIGDHFAVLADPDDPVANGAEFFVLLCTKPMYVVEEEMMTDAWGGVVERGDEVVEGLYYQQQGLKQNSYVLLGSVGVARLYSHLVCAIKFCMRLAKHKQKGNTTIYQLSEDALRKIDTIVRSKEQAEDLNSEGEEHESDIDCGNLDLSNRSSASDSNF